MKLYLDSADAQQWRLPAGCPPVAGVTTNPTLVHQAGLPVTLAGYTRLVQQAAQAGLPELMLQLPQPDVPPVQDWVGELLRVAAAEQVLLTFKLPCRAEWAQAVRAVHALGAPTLLTGLSNPVQLLWAQAQGAHYVAPYVSRLLADGREVWPLLQACVQAQQGGVRLLAASIKTADDLSRLMAMGAHAVTLRPEFVASLATDALTDAALRQFEADIQASRQT